MASLTHQLTLGEDYYIDPFDGGNKITKGTLLGESPFQKGLYVVVSKDNKTINLARAEQLTKNKASAKRHQKAKRLRALIQVNHNPKNISELLKEIENISQGSGEKGQLIRDLIKRSSHLTNE